MFVLGIIGIILGVVYTVAGLVEGDPGDVKWGLAITAGSALGVVLG